MADTRRMIRSVALAGFASVVLLAGCASKAASSQDPNDRPSVAQPSAYHPATGEDAAFIARHIPGCIRVTRLSTGHAPSLSSAASCQLNTDTVIIDSWSGRTAITNDVVPRQMWFVDGGAWTGFVADRGVTPARSWLQLALTGDVEGTAHAKAHPPKAVPLQEQQRVAIAVATGVSGAITEAH